MSNLYWRNSKVMEPEEFQRVRKIEDGDGNTYTITLPEPPPKEEIAGWDLDIEQQRWMAPVITKAMTQAEEDREWLRSKKGYWFYNHGNIEYLTGHHYFYLTHWRIKPRGIKPFFRSSDRDFYYLWDYAENDPNIYGLLYITDRRSGKTWRSTQIGYKTAIYDFDANCGIQSKTNPDAKEIFDKIVYSWKKLPEFFKPMEASGQSSPARRLEFAEPSKKSTKVKEKKYKTVLNSIIDYKPSNEEAYDGFQLKFVYHDEVGKKTDADPRKRYHVVKPCLEDGDEVYGKALLTTTVEETEREGGEAVQLLWDESDVSKLDDNGRTISGLIRYFRPTSQGLSGFMCEYGYPIMDDPEEPIMNEKGKLKRIGAKTFIANKRKNLTGAKLNEEIRKYPESIREAFIIDSQTETFPSHKIYEQKSFNASVKYQIVRRGNFITSESNDGREAYEFRDDPQGRWWISWMPPQEQRNAIQKRAGIILPGNIHKGGIGVDPFDHDQVANDRASDGGIAVFRKFDSSEPSISNSFTCLYKHRPENSREFYNDVKKTMVFYGYPTLIENQKPGCINHFKDNGYIGYLQKTLKSEFTQSKSRTWTYGISTAGKMVREEMVDALHLYIYDFVGKIAVETQVEKMGIPATEVMAEMYGNFPFDFALDEFIRFSSEGKWTDFDITVACMLARMSVRKNARQQKKESDKMSQPIFKKHRVG